MQMCYVKPADADVQYQTHGNNKVIQNPFFWHSNHRQISLIVTEAFNQSQVTSRKLNYY